MSVRFRWAVTTLTALFAGLGACGGGTSAPSEEPTEGAVDASTEETTAVADSADHVTAPDAADGAAPLRTAPGEIAIVDVGTLNDPTSGMVSVFDALQNGAAQPLRRFHSVGPSGYWGPVSVWGDALHDEIIVGTDANLVAIDIFAEQTVEAYPRTTDGDAAVPIRRVTFGGGVGSIAVDTAHDELLVVDERLATYARTADGAAAPTRTFSEPNGGDFTMMAFDAVHDEVALGVETVSSTHSIAFYSRSAAVGATPLRTIGGPQTRLVEPNGIAVDPVHDELFVSNRNGSIQVYSRTANGDVPPLRTISGTPAELDPVGLALDVANGELFVINVGNAPLASVYDRLASGNATPLRRILASQEGPPNPRGIAIVK